MEEQGAGAALTASVLDENISAIMADVADVVLHSEWAESPLKDIPVVSWLVKACGITANIRDRLFLKKLARFLQEAGRLPSKARNVFRKRMVEDPKFQRRCGESILMLIDKLSSATKARFMGFAFRRFAEGAIDEVILNRIYAALEHMPEWQLFDIREYYFENGLGSMGFDAAALYQQLGLIDIYYGDKAERLHCDFPKGGSYFMSYHQPHYKGTDIGLSVAEVVRDYFAEPD